MSYYYKYLKYKNKYLVLKNHEMIGGILPYQEEYKQIIINYKKEIDKINKIKFSDNSEEIIIKEKKKVIDLLSRIINQINIEINIEEKELLKKDFLNLRILMDNKFIRDIKCKYTYLFTPKKYGCDLLELLYNILSSDEEIRLRNTILTGIASCSLDKSSIPHILTDIDDTIYAHPGMFGINIAGSDYSWKKKELYPGLEEFYRYFTEFTQSKHEDIIIYKTILSATPTALKNHKLKDANLIKALGNDFSFLSGKDSKIDAIKDIDVGKKSKIDATKDIDKDPSIQKLEDNGENSIEPNAESVATTKFERFVKYKALFPEYKLLFIGDNGQGDLIAGEKMLNVDKDCMVFIHNIIKKDENFKFNDEKISEYISKPINKERLFFFKNYYELSQIFQQKNLLNECHVDSIREIVSSKLKQKLSISDVIKNKNYHCCVRESCDLGCIKK